MKDDGDVIKDLLIYNFFPLRFYAVTSRRYNTLSYCSNGVKRTVKHQQQHQQQQQQFVCNDKPTSQLTAHMLQHQDNGDVTAAAAGRQYFVLDPEQQ